MRKLTLLSLLSVAVIFVAVSCTKEGPEGPVGASGAQGPSGPQGPVGPAGPVGQTNVTYSAWFVTGSAGWTQTGADSYLAEWLYDKTAPGVTQTIIDNGIVLAYMKGDPNLVGAPINTSNQTFPLPNSVGHSFGFIDTYSFVLNAPGNIRFLYFTTFPFFDNTDLGAISFRYVIIPGSIAGGKGTTPRYEGYTVPELKAMSYDQIASLFHIPADGSNIK